MREFQTKELSLPPLTFNKLITMKKSYLFAALSAACAITTTSCTNELEEYTPQEVLVEQGATITRSFAKPDESKRLSGTPAENLKALFEAAGPGVITSLGRMNITDSQYQEIAEFTTNLVGADDTQTEKYRNIFRWVVSNVKYGQDDNDPYAVFTNKVAVCQGYANLLTVMCHTQGIPAVVVNGFLQTSTFWGGHAWAYTCPDGVWEVSDPTNGGSWPMSNIKGYTHLVPSEADVDLFIDECATYRYYDYNLNVNEIITEDNPLSIPYSVGGFVITSFNPSAELPENTAEIYIGENITTFGESYNMHFVSQNFGQFIQAIYVDDKNPMLMGHKGVVYRKNGDERQLYYIPGNMSFVELLPMEKVEKNTIYNHYGVEEIYFPKGTKRIESYAIENCPKLKRVYVPTDAIIDDQALYKTPENVEIVRGEPNGIKNILMD